MTWYYELNDDNSKMNIYDQSDNLVKTLENDGNGFTILDDVCSVMRSEAEKARSNSNMDRWRDIHIRLADDDIAPKE